MGGRTKENKGRKCKVPDSTGSGNRAQQWRRAAALLRPVVLRKLWSWERSPRFVFRTEKQRPSVSQWFAEPPAATVLLPSGEAGSGHFCSPVVVSVVTPAHCNYPNKARARKQANGCLLSEHVMHGFGWRFVTPALSATRNAVAAATAYVV